MGKAKKEHIIDCHTFPLGVEQYIPGVGFQIRLADGKTSLLAIGEMRKMIDGSERRWSGIFEYAVDNKGIIFHRFFRPRGVLDSFNAYSEDKKNLWRFIAIARAYFDSLRLF